VFQQLAPVCTATRLPIASPPCLFGTLTVINE
jgi:hypothetical protein